MYCVFKYNFTRTGIPITTFKIICNMSIMFLDYTARKALLCKIIFGLAVAVTVTYNRRRMEDVSSLADD